MMFLLQGIVFVWYIVLILISTPLSSELIPFSPSRSKTSTNHLQMLASFSSATSFISAIPWAIIRCQFLRVWLAACHWQRTKSYLDHPFSHPDPFQRLIHIHVSTFLCLISFFNASCVCPVWLHLTSFLLNVAKLFMNCCLPICSRLFRKRRRPFIIEFLHKSICQNIQDRFIPVTLGLGHSASKPKGFVRSLHGLSFMCFYVLNRYAASMTTRLL